MKKAAALYYSLASRKPQSTSSSSIGETPGAVDCRCRPSAILSQAFQRTSVLMCDHKLIPPAARGGEKSQGSNSPIPP